MATEKRLIDANALSQTMESNLYWGLDSDGAILDTIDEAPTVDAVEVVRCMDCRHCDPENRHCDHPMGTTSPIPRKTDDFCSYGERKENNNAEN